MPISNIKSAIKTHLDALVTAEVLGGATETDFKTDPLSADVGTFPHAFVMPPAMASEVLDNRSILRTYTFDILILFQAEDITTTSELETAIEAILNEFDNDPTLGNQALGGVMPVTGVPTPFQHGGKDLIAVELQLQAKQYVSLSFA